MKGALADGDSLFGEALSANLFPETSTYHFNSGGNPRDIPDLTLQQLQEFHGTAASAKALN